MNAPTIRDDFRVEPASWDADFDDLRSVREQVFVVEQAVPREDEIDEQDPKSRHVIARDADGRAIGTGRLTPAHAIGRVAVLVDWRGRGVGQAIMRVLLEQARALGYPAVELHSQAHAIPFYAALGFHAEGEPFIECGIPHQAMRLDLEAGAPREQRPLAPVPEARLLVVEDREQALAAVAELLADAKYELAIYTRDLDAALQDHVTLRPGWAQVLEPCRLAALVGAVLRRRGWTGSPRPCGSGCLVDSGAPGPT